MIVAVGNMNRGVDPVLLHHFYKHYTEWGVSRFYWGVYSGRDNPHWDLLADCSKAYDAVLIPWMDGVFENNKDLAFFNHVRQQLGPDDWYVPHDTDEFVVVPGYRNLNDVVAACAKESASWVTSELVDRITMNGTIPPALTMEPSIWQQFPRIGTVTKRIQQSWTVKVALARSDIAVTSGHHKIVGSAIPFKKTAQTHHFKWYGNLYEREAQKLLGYVQQKKPWITEIARLLTYMNLNDGRVT
jgi:hypothetical protein